MHVERLASVFKALSDETRLKILYLLGIRPLCVCEIMGALNITQTKASRHLIYLKNAGLLGSRKEDRWVLYEIRKDLPEALKGILEKARLLTGKAEGMSEIERRLEVILAQESLYRQLYSPESGKAAPACPSCAV